MKLSVFIPVYNREEFIGEAISSILNQTYTDFELIIVDDASQDKTANIIHSFNDSRIQYFRNDQNLGISKTRNKGFQLAQGQYFAILDSDDIAAPHRLKMQLEFMEENPHIALCGSAFREISPHHNIDIYLPTNHQEIHSKLALQNTILQSSVMLRMSVIIQNQLYYNESYQPSEDYDLWCRISRHHQLANLPTILAYYRKHSTNVSSTSQAQQINNAFKISSQQIENLLQRKLEQSELSIHKALGDYCLTHNIEPEKIKNWCVYLDKINTKRKTYHPFYFRKALGNCWLMSFRKASQIHLHHFLSFLTFPFHKEMSLGIRDLMYIYRHHS